MKCSLVHIKIATNDRVNTYQEFPNNNEFTFMTENTFI